MTVNLFIDIFFFHVHSTVSFFSKLVIPVHVSMEEPVFKTKVEKSTSVNVLVDAKETIASKNLQVYICGMYGNPAISIDIAFRCSVRGLVHYFAHQAFSV